MPNTVAISDASGGIGTRVTRRLAERGVAMRLVVEDRSDAPQFDGAHVVEASYRDGSTMRQALGGADTMLFVPAHESADRAGVHRGVIDAAVRAGVQRIVYLSFVSAAPDAVFTFARDHWHTEERLRETGLPVTVLRGSVYMNYLFMIAGDDDVIRAPAGNGRFAPVDRDDMADVTIAALLDSSHDGRTYHVTGPEPVDDVGPRGCAVRRGWSHHHIRE